MPRKLAALQPAAAGTPNIVLDTNAVLDCWLFEDPAARPLREAVQAGRLRWLATADMLAELGHVLARPLDGRWEPQRERLLCSACFRALPTIGSMFVGPPCALRCSDPDDQKFLDLALQERVRWLATRDRALLKLRRGAAAYGLTIFEPAEFQAAIGGLGQTGR